MVKDKHYISKHKIVGGEYEYSFGLLSSSCAYFDYCSKEDLVEFLIGLYAKLDGMDYNIEIGTRNCTRDERKLFLKINKLHNQRVEDNRALKGIESKMSEWNSFK